MVSRKLFAILICALATAALLPSTANAQSSTFVVDLIRTGTPGTTTATQTDPMTGEPTTVVVDTGAFINPCTFENVDVTGSTTITTLQTVDRFGTMKVNVSAVSKGNGRGWLPSPDGTQGFTGSTYSFNDSQQFTFRLPVAGEEFASDFTDKLAMKGSRSVDNWVIRAHFRVKVSATGAVQVLLIKTNTDVCKG